MTTLDDLVGSDDEAERPTSPKYSNGAGRGEDLDIPEGTRKFVKGWIGRIKAGKKYHKKAFERMRWCQKMARRGADENWSDDKYTVAVINRHINQAVAQLYAKNPTTQAKRKKRRMFTVWDGTLASLQEAEGTLKAAAAIPGTPIDPNMAAIVQDATTVKQYDTLMDGVADTLTLLNNHFVQEPAAQYKAQFKGLVRRTKVCGVGYVKLGFERILEQKPDVTVKIADVTEQLAVMERLLGEKAEDDLDDDSSDMEQLRTLLKNLQSEETLVVKEGPVFSFPKARNIIPDPATYQLKTWSGTDWLAEEFADMTCDRIEEIWKVDVRGNYTGYKALLDRSTTSTWSERDSEMSDADTARVWRVQNRKTNQVFVLCDGYPGYLQEPAPPDVKLSRFFDIFPLVFNEIEDDEEIFPPSDVWNTRHLQNEYNRSREGLREHRQQNRPAYVAGPGTFEETDLQKLSNHASGDIIVINALGPNEDIAKKLQPKPTVKIDPALYDVKEIWNDILRVVGSQQADFGPTTDSTATESQIAAQARSVTTADQVDDIDELLSLLAHSTGEVLLTEMSKETVISIVGPGAVWPDMQQTREEIAEAILLETRAGSSGRPNQAGELAKMDKAMPNLVQLPNLNPTPWVQKYLDLLDVDAEDAVIQGLPSIASMNQMLSHPGQGQPGAPNAPGSQGPQGANNAPQPPGQAPHPAVGPPPPIPH